MDTENKLKYFYNSTMSAIEHKNEKEITALKANLESEIESFKKQTDEESIIEERLHRSAAKRELQKSSAFETLEIRRNVAEKEAALKAQLFKEVKLLLANYRMTPAYTDTLVEFINAANDFAQGEEIKIYICPSDENLLETLKERTGLPLIVSDVPFDGGIQAEIPGRNIFINSSFSSRLADEQEAYEMKP